MGSPPRLAKDAAQIKRILEEYRTTLAYINSVRADHRCDRHEENLMTHAEIAAAKTKYGALAGTRSADLIVRLIDDRAQALAAAEQALHQAEMLAAVYIEGKMLAAMGKQLDPVRETIRRLKGEG